MSDSKHIQPSFFEHLTTGRPTRPLAAREVLFDQGDVASGLYCLTRGRLRLERHLPRGVALTVGVLQAPSLVGEASLFVDRVHCRAVAETRAEVTWLPRNEALRLLEEPATAKLFVEHLAGEVRDLRSRLELQNVRPATERVLAYLQLRAEGGQQRTERSLAAIAAEIGLTPEAMYRTVRKLQSEGRVRRDGRSLSLPPET